MAHRSHHGKGDGWQLYRVIIIALASLSISSLLTFVTVPLNAQMQSDKTIHDNIVISPLTAIKEYLSHKHEPAPVGMGAYGFYYDQGTLQPITITTNKVLAIAKINSLSAYDPQTIQTPQGASLQFNVMLEVKTSEGTTLRWIQDVVGFDNTVTNELKVADNIWNPVFQHANVLAYGRGQLQPSNGKNFYVYQGPDQRYSLPLTLKLGMSVETTSSGVVVYFYNDPFGHGTFDKVLLPFKNVISAKMVVAPRHLRNNEASMDSELVWGGDAGGSRSIFEQMDSTISMYYENSTGKFEPFPSFFTFGTQTAETATNLLVERDPHGGHVVIGTNDNHFLEQLRSLTPAQPDNDFIQLRQQLEEARNQVTQSQDNSSSASIPAWIKNNAKWWADGTIDDPTFSSGIQYLIKQGIIQVPATQSGSTTQAIPSWVKNNAKWWAEGQMSDDEFIKAIQYLVSSDIIQVNS